MNIDPLADKYVGLSPYNHVLNNPVFFVDPDGRQVIIGRLDGMSDDEYKNFRNQTLSHLQQLTDNKLEIDDNGRVTEAECQGESCSEGTSLISELVNSDKVHTILYSNDRNKTKPENEEDASNGVGSNTTILYNPNRTEGGVNEDGSKERPAEIGLAHELGHSRDIGRGEEENSIENYWSDYIEPYEDLEGDGLEEFNSFVPVPTREARVRKNTENPVRVEQNQSKRKLIRRSKWRRNGRY